MVSNIVRQPWAVDAIREMQNDFGKDKVQELLRAEVLPSVQQLVEARDNSKNATRDRSTASVAILDRFYGKPNQPHSHTTEVDLESLTDSELGAMLISN